MKKTFLLLLTFLIVGVGTTQAQDNTKAIKKLLKTSTKALKKYSLDPSSNIGKLDEANAAISDAMKLDGADKMPELWLAKASISQSIAEQDIIARNDIMKQNVLAGTPDAEINYMVKNPSASVEAFGSYAKALELTEKKAAKLKIVKELEKNTTFLNDIASLLYSNNKDYANAYQTFYTLVQASNLVKTNGGNPLLDTDDKVEEMTYYSAVCAQLAKMDTEANTVYKEMYDAGSKKIEVYDALFKANIEKDETTALKYLEEGRAIDPENTSLLFSEINYYLQKGDYKTLEGKLQMAMDKEPNNASLRAVMGNVYNDFYKKEKDVTKAQDYFGKAEKYYNEALEIDDESFEALYSLGELNYNKAAGLVAKYNELPISASAKEVDGLKSDFLAAFEKALPFFLKADEINPKDYNTLTALKEIYARKDDFAKSKEYKTRIEGL